VRRWPLAAVLTLAGCAYYNGLWSANRLASDARKYEDRGMVAEARLNWGRAAAKAETVLVHHPHSRWADDALVLQGEGLARSGTCDAALAPLNRAITTVTDDALRERASLAAAMCAVQHGKLSDAERYLAPVLESHDASRRSTAFYIAGLAAQRSGDQILADRRFAASTQPEAASARVVALAAAGRPAAAVAVVDSVARRDDNETRWSDALDSVAQSSGAVTAADALDRLVARGKLRAASRARLLLADGDRLRTARVFARALARYGAVAALVPDSVESARARVQTERLHLAQARTPEDLDSVSARLVDLAAGGLAVGEARALQSQIRLVRREDTTGVKAFRDAEMVRDSLAAPALAAELFLRFAAMHPTSLFAPKALIAAGQLRPEVLDSVDTVLRAQYVESPYTQAFHGRASPAYQAMEDSLATALGVSRARVTGTGSAALTLEPPRTGPRGPDLEALVLARASQRAAPTKRPTPVRRPGEKTPAQPDDRP
jgi:predicted negative regulator of RcsB-dependent stress response